MKKILFPVLISIFMLALWACKKTPDWSDILPETPVETEKAKLSGWSFKGNNISYSGCIDTAYYSKIDTVILLNIGLSDSLGNTIRITLNDPSGKFSPGSYTTSTENATIVVLTTSGNYTITDKTTAFSIELTAISDSLVEGIFAARLVNPLNNAPLNISNGKIRALIGKKNRCTERVQDSAAIFTLDGTGTGCTNAVLQGAYIVGSDLNTTNTLTVQVNVSSRGLYSISSSKANGFSFGASGTFATAGPQTITLTGSGTPLVNGVDSFSLTAGGTTCKIGVNTEPINGMPNAVFSSPNNLCDSAKIFGTYRVGVALNNSNKVNIRVNVSTPGNYSISTTTVSGMTFLGTGTFNATGLQTVTLQGSGTPFKDGLFNIPVSIRSQSCNFKLRVDTANLSFPIPINSWIFNVGTRIYSGPITLASYGGDIVTGKSLLILGNTTTGSDTTLQLYVQLPADANFPTPGIYQTNPSTFSNNTTDFNFLKGDVFSVNKIYYAKTGAGAGQPVNLNIRIVSYDQNRKVVQGTFTGKVWDKTGTVVNITSGIFKAEVR